MCTSVRSKWYLVLRQCDMFPMLYEWKFLNVFVLFFDSSFCCFFFFGFVYVGKSCIRILCACSVNSFITIVRDVLWRFGWHDAFTMIQFSTEKNRNSKTVTKLCSFTIHFSFYHLHQRHALSYKTCDFFFINDCIQRFHAIVISDWKSSLLKSRFDWTM